MKDRHFCATCKNFKIIKEIGKKPRYLCTRLKYETKPKFKFKCWEDRGLPRTDK